MLQAPVSPCPPALLMPHAPACHHPGNSLFHVVVDSADVALKCTELLQRAKAGRITFMPLDTLHPPTVRGPWTRVGVRKLLCPCMHEGARVCPRMYVRITGAKCPWACCTRPQCGGRGFARVRAR